MSRRAARTTVVILVVITRGVLMGAVVAKGPVDLDWHGVLEVGARYINRDHGSNIPHGDVYNDEIRQIAEAVIEAEVDIGERLEARFDLRGDVNDLGVVLRKAYVDFDATPWLQLRFGNAKRAFTMEEMVGREELLTPDRSLANEQVASFHVLGYALGLHARGRWRHGGYRRTTGWLGVSIDGAGRFVSIATARYGLSGRASATGSLLFLAPTAGSDTRVTAGMAAAGWELEDTRMYTAIELVGGKDPNATELHRRMGDTTTILFGLIRGACFPFWELGAGLLRGLRPGLTAVYLVPGFDSGARGRVQLIPSCNLIFGPGNHVRLMVGGDFLVHTDLAAGELRKEAYGATVQLQVAW